ncbi:M15 family metallopeptidase [Paenibacillus glycinis]|uniref:D-alanyl-D-alanine carboxypeptidase-like core domain-containing protein n=1 Tax=Paenibacillus glycinis TaxID=2697035 RepID=A0ABW9XRF2_9BACL|nr:M15 family metallopeptidase [Paenibacillus glycinis]NBD25231.1 hypothetical protein [Paenibacillus glycinis]
MKKARLAGLVVLALIVAEAGRHANAWMSREAAVPVPNAPAAMHAVHAGRDQPYRGDLVLIDGAHPVREAGRQTDIIRLFDHPELRNGYGLANTAIALSKRAADKWQLLADAAREDGIDRFFIMSGYRNDAEQARLYEEKGSLYELPPGFGEHSLGLSFDVGSAAAEMNRAPEGRWLSKHAWEYGFILRYPQEKTAVTGIRFEPWHLRYVGMPHSALMHRYGWTLEEYLEALKQRKSMSTAMDGVEYEVTYYAASAAGDTAIRVPAAGAYMVSGDNRGGIIVTIQTRTATGA